MIMSPLLPSAMPFGFVDQVTRHDLIGKRLATKASRRCNAATLLSSGATRQTPIDFARAAT